MPDTTTRRGFLISTTTVAAAALAAPLAGCSRSERNDSPPAAPAQFRYGVASGDPLADRVVLWTHAQVPGSQATVSLTWQVSLLPDFVTPVASGSAEASAATGFTVKVDATGLAAGTRYFYRFIDNTGVVSASGVTRTLPGAQTGAVKLAVMSCALYPAGLFNAYDAVARSDAQFAVFLGDYLYEYGAGPLQFGNQDAVALGRVNQPANDLVSLADYRTRYAEYRSDAQLQALHAAMPWIAVWDDHEFADNAFANGASNHNPATQGDWAARKAAAAQAWLEWLPVRLPDPANPLKIYRRFDFGNLCTLHMLDTRIDGRVQQYANGGDPIATPGYQYADYLAGLTPVNGVYPDASRTLVSAAQQAWLVDGMAASSAAWQLLGNQVLMARQWVPVSVLATVTAAVAAPSSASLQVVLSAVASYLTAKATRAAAGAGALTASQAALLDPVANPRLPLDLDAWDGYPLARESVLQAAKAQGKRLVALSGDSHNAWFSKLTTLAGERAGVEFGVTSVTSPGIESTALGALGSSLAGSLDGSTLGGSAVGASLGLIDDLDFVDTSHRGALLLTVTADAVVGQYLFVDTVKAAAYTASVGRTITVAAGGAISYG